MIFSNYNIILFLAILYIFAISLILFILGYFLVPRNSFYIEKFSTYECGFDPFSNPRENYSVQFYLVSVIFLIFDVEIVFFYPLIYCFVDIEDENLRAEIYHEVMLFLIILTLGFIYELDSGVLDW
jgi:NADH:ubiquinone oxidoreductase subunit 3 (subunit A)